MHLLNVLTICDISIITLGTLCVFEITSFELTRTCMFLGIKLIFLAKQDVISVDER